MADFSKELNRKTEEHPILTTLFITFWIWHGSYRLGINVGEFNANFNN
ncbi:hypothetical protein [Bacillus sp. ISL-37]|nr:hypothetical protein [Bacillus sp. ISL-37]MBT2682165.1 hypothetical protein [Bacillus sp. ISL-37]